MASVDNRVVDMGFNNAAFESKIAATMASLEKLKGHLNFSGAKASIADLTAVSNSFTLQGMAAATEHIASKFNALHAVAFSAISNITNKAMNMGQQLIKSFTIDPVKSGFTEYELKMGAIQTIMAGTGQPLEIVNTKLKELNAYSDKTIYSFKDMTSNISKFTNAGVSLDESVAAIQGVANAAALSGANAEEAGRAMYNFGQALSTGSVKLMDWKSIENANMATVEFKTQLMESAVAAGTLTKSADGLYTSLEGTEVNAKNFNTTLEQQWLTSEALTAALGNYADETTDIGKRATAAATTVKSFTQMMDTLKESAGSGWAESSELIFGNLDEAKYLFTGLNSIIGGVIGSSAEARNKILGDFRDLGGRDVIVEALFNAFTALGNVLKPIKEAFREIFPRKTGKDLFNLAVGLRSFVQSLILTPEAMDKVKRVFKGLFGVISIGVNVVKGIFGFFKDLLGIFFNFSGGGILNFFAILGDGLYGVSELAKGHGISDFFDGIINSVQKVYDVISPIFSKIGDKIHEFQSFFRMGLFGSGGIGGSIDGIAEFAFNVGRAFDNIIEKAQEFGTAFLNIKDKISSGLGEGIGSGITESFNNVKDILLSGLRTIVDSVLNFFGISSPSSMFFDIGNNIITGLVNGIKAALGFLEDVFSFIGDFISGISFDDAMKVVDTGLLAGFLVVFKQLKDTFKGWGKIGESVTNAIDGVTGVLKGMETKLKAEALMKIATALAILTVSIVVISMIDAAKLGIALGAMAVGFGQLAVMMKILDKTATGPKDAVKIALLATGLILVAGAIFILAAACKVFSLLSVDELAKGLVTVTVILATLAVISKPVSQNSDGMIKAGIGITAFAGAILILGLAVKLFSMMDPVKMTQGLVAVGLLLAGLAIAVKYFSDNSEGMIKAGVGIVLITMSLGNLANAVERFGKMDWKVLVQGMLAISAALIILVTAIRKMPDDAASKGAGILLLAGALWILALAVEKFGNMDILVLVKGLLAVGAALILINIAMDSMPKGDELIKQGLGLLMLSVGLLAIATVVKILGSMSLGDLIKGLSGLGVIMFGLAAAMKIMPDGKDLALKGTGLILVAGALVLLVGAVKALASLSMGDLIKGLVGLAAIFLVIGLAGHFLTPVIPTLIAFGIAMVLIGGGLALVGLGALLLAKAFGILVKIIVDNIESMVMIFDLFVNNITKFLKALAKAFIEMVKTAIAALPDIIKSLDETIIAFLDLVIRSIPKLAEVFLTFISTILDVLVEIRSDIIQAGMDLLIALLKGIRDNIGEIVTTVSEIIVNFLDALTAKLPDIIASGLNLLTAFLQGIADNIGQISTAVVNLITAFVTAFTNAHIQLITAGFDILIAFLKGISDNISNIVTTVGEVITRFITELGLLAGDIVAAGVAALVSFLEGVGKGIGQIAAKITEVIVEFIFQFGENSELIVAAGVAALVSFLDGIGDGIKQIAAKITEVVTEIIFQIGENVNDIILAGKDFIIEFLGGFAMAIKEIAEAMGDFVVDVINGLADVIRQKSKELEAAGANLVNAIVVGMGGSVANLALDTATFGMFSRVKSGWNSLWEANSPSKVMIKLAGYLVEGIAIGLNQSTPAEKSAENLANKTLTSFQNSLSKIPTVLEGLNEFNPTITPVLDLTNVKREAGKLSNLLGVSSLSAILSYDQARIIASGTNITQDELATANPRSTTEIKFEQTINSPTALSTADIYRQTRNQIAMAKEELAVL